MKRELAEQFNREVETYRKALLFYARKCDWEEFKAKAGRLFDYVESVELSETERRFSMVFNSLLAVLGLAVLALFGVDFSAHTGLQGMKQVFILTSIAGSTFELYFYLDFRIYREARTSFYGRRRAKFIRGLEQDFQTYAVQAERKAA